MRFAAAHKASTYAMVACAYLALATSGELPAPVLVLSLVALPASWWWEPPRIRYERYTLAWTVLTLVLFAASILTVLAGGDFLVAGADFLLYLQLAKLFARRTLRDYLQIYLLSFLMLVAATVLNTELTYGLCFLGYVVCSTWALASFHLRREVEDNFLVSHGERPSEAAPLARVLGSRRIVTRGFFLGTGAVSLGVFLAASILFLFIPRIGFGLFVSKGRGSTTMAGFSDGVQLGGLGVIKDDDTVVMRVVVSKGFGGRDAPELYWRGVAFDHYEHGAWKRSPRAPLTGKRTYADARSTTYHLLYDRPRLDDGALAARQRHALRQDIFLEALGTDALFGAAMPVAFELETSLEDLGSETARKNRARHEYNDEIRHARSGGIKYVAYSEPTPPPIARLRAAPHQVPPGYEVYLEVPAEITPATRTLAHDLTRGLASDYDKVMAIQTWLRDHLTYTLEMASPGDDEPIDFFLFQRKQGHCEYFSSALAILARIAGVPTRNVDGFLGGEWNEYADYIAVRAGDAHSWDEIYLGGIGWVTIDPTPPGQVDQLGRGGDGFFDRLRRLTDTLRFKWAKWVIDYDLTSQLGLLKRFGAWLRSGPGQLVSRAWAGTRGFVARHLVLGGLAAAALIGLVAALALRRRRRRELLIVAGPGRRGPRQPTTRIYLDVLRRLARRGHRRALTQTPREHAFALRRARVAGAAELCELVELHYAAEYGGGDPAALTARAHELAHAIDRAQRDRRRSA